ncbi:MAG: VCBS repeat-containing protein, partial [Acidobacteriaceae bacterium]|nr:VCBS repeat-containing protein [Acidobacteriaceae bacterium]
MAGVLLSLPLVAAATVPQETFLPPQQIPLPGTMTFGKLVVADVNGDGYDDIVAIGTDIVDSTAQIVLDVYVNEGKPRSSAEDVTFIKQRLILKDHANADAAMDKVKFSGGFDLQVVDLDNDGKPDILASSAATGEIFVLWNQGTNAPAPFVFVPDAETPDTPSMTFFSPLAQKSGGDNVLGTPIFVTAANLGEGSGRKSIVAYHGALQPDSTSSEPAPFNQRNYESLAILYPYELSARGFRAWLQRLSWPGCDLSFGAACPGWSDGLTAGTSLYNYRPADQLRLNFDSAASDILTIDSSSTEGANHYYTPAVMRPNASPGLQVLTGHGANGSDSIWLQGGGQVHEFVADNSLKLMRQRTVIDSVAGNERSAGATFGTLSTGATPLITAGGMRVVYEPSNAGSAVTQPVPDYLNRAGQVGSWLQWVSLNTGSALLSLSDYCRSPDPCAKDLSWYHKPLNGDPPPATFWGGSRTLVMLDFAKETTTASGVQYEPFFQAPDEAHFQAFSITGGSVTHKPFIATGHFASTSESAIVMLDHADGTPTDALWNHLSLYRPDTAKTYSSPVPHLDGLTVGRFIEDGLADIGNTLPKGEVSAVLVGTHLGTDTADAIRYVTVHDKTTGAMKGIFPVTPAETVKELSKDGVVVPGLSTLDIGSYTLEVHNATATASMNLNVVNPFGITTTDYDWRAGNTCGLLPNTKDGTLWPKQIAVSVTDFPGTIQAIRWINQDDGSVVNLGSEGGTYDATAKTVTLIVPQGKLKDGKWRAAIESNGLWQPVQRVWNVTHDSAALASCATQVDFVNEEAYAQCDNDSYYLDAAQYAVWPHLVNRSFRFFGSGFGLNQIKSAAIKQGTHRYFSSSLELVSDNEIHVEFGDLSVSLTPDVTTDLYFYSETGDVVEADGVPASGGKQRWRTVRKGTCLPQMPQVGQFLNTGSGENGTWQSGDVIEVAVKNALYPVPSAVKLLLKDDGGSVYMLEDPHLPDDWYFHHYDNDNLVLYFSVPEDLNTVKISDARYG